MIEVGTFVGIPYKPLGRGFDGADCWGLCLIAAKNLYNLHFPEFFYDEKTILEDAEKLIGGERSELWNKGQWMPVDRVYFPGDVHLFRIKGHETHCGIHIGGGDFLHCLPGRNSCVESLRDSNWTNRKTGSYRWAMS